MMLLLALISCVLFFKSAAQPAPPPPTIAWDRCGVDAECAVSDSAECLASQPGTGNQLKFGVKAAEINLATCATGLWIRPLSDTTWIVKMQVKRDAGTVPIINPIGGFTLKHEGASVLRCVIDNEGKVVAQGEGNRKIALYGFETSRLKENDFYCSFLIEDADQIASLAKGKTTLEYVVTAEIQASSNDFKKIASRKTCDMGNAMAKAGKTFYGVTRSAVDINLDEEFVCASTPGSKLYAGHYLPGPPIVMKLDLQPVVSLKCHKPQNGDFVYKISYEKDGAIKDLLVPKGKKFNAFCGVPASTEPAPPSIDWSRCGEEAVCAVRDSADCLDNVQNRKGDMLFGQAAVNPQCHTGIWIRPLNNKEWIVKMQVKDERIDPVKGMFLNHTGDTLFGCIQDNGNVIPHALRKDLEVSMYGFEESRLKESDCYCSFHIKRADVISSLPAGETFMEYVLTTGMYDLATSNEFAKVNDKRRCDMFKATTDFTKPFPGFIKHPFKDLLSLHLTCNFLPHSKLYGRYGGNHLKELGPLESIECENTGTVAAPRWKYVMTRKVEKLINGQKVEVEKSEIVPVDTQFEAFCAVPVDSSCIDPEFKGLYPPKFDQDSEGKVSLTCENRKWLINDQFYSAPNHFPFCKMSDDHPNEARWHIKHKGRDVQITDAECTEDILCTYSATIKNTCTKADKDQHGKSRCDDLIRKDGIRCPVEHQLTVIQTSGEKLTMEKLVCNVKKGVWTIEGQMDAEIDQNADIYCLAQKKVIEAAMSANTSIVISGVLVGLVILVTGCFVIRFFIERA